LKAFWIQFHRDGANAKIRRKLRTISKIQRLGFADPFFAIYAFLRGRKDLPSAANRNRIATGEHTE
jgi:hypothetical protein